MNSSLTKDPGPMAQVGGAHQAAKWAAIFSPVGAYDERPVTRAAAANRPSEPIGDIL